MSTQNPQEALATLFKMDGWQNLFTQLGISGKDSRIAGAYVARARLTETEVLDLYRENWAAQRYAEAIVADAVKAWYDLEIKDQEEDEGTDDGKPDLDEMMEDELTRLQVKAKFEEANIWARVLGGSALLVGADDGQDVSQPLAEDRIKSVRYLHLVDKRYIRCNGDWDNEPNSPNFGMPLLYSVQPPGGTATTWHWSRVLRFEGQRVTEDRRRELQSWGDSAYESAYGPLRNYQQIMDSAATAGQAFVQGVLKVKGFSEMMATDSEAQIVARILGFKLGLSMTGLATVDSEYEEYTRLGMPITGLPELMDRLGLDLAGALEMPQSKLYGNQAGKLAGATEDTKTWDNQVDRHRGRNLTPQLTYLTKLLFLAKEGPAKGKEPDFWRLKAEPLTQPDKDKEADRDLKRAQTLDVYFKAGALEPSEMRPAAGDIQGVKLNPDITAKIEEADLAAQNEPANPAEPPVPGNPAIPPQPAGPAPEQAPKARAGFQPQ